MSVCAYSYEFCVLVWCLYMYRHIHLHICIHVHACYPGLCVYRYLGWCVISVCTCLVCFLTFVCTYVNLHVCHFLCASSPSGQGRIPHPSVHLSLSDTAYDTTKYLSASLSLCGRGKLIFPWDTACDHHPSR